MEAKQIVSPQTQAIVVWHPQSNEGDVKRSSSVQMMDAEEGSQVDLDDEEGSKLGDESRSESTLAPPVPPALLNVLRSHWYVH